MKVIFTKAHTYGGVPRKAGEVLEVDNTTGLKLIEEGIAKERPPQEPTETKTPEAKPPEPKPEEPDKGKKT